VARRDPESLWRIHNRVNDVIAAVTWGNPCRATSVANGNVFAGWPMPGDVDGVVTGGIAGPDDLTPAQKPGIVV
jgi:hypothetical protein